MKCPNCGAEGNGKFCQHCGSKMPEKPAEVPTTIAGAVHGIVTSVVGEVGKQLEYQRDHADEIAERKRKEEEQKTKETNKVLMWLAIAGIGIILFCVLMGALEKRSII